MLTLLQLCPALFFTKPSKSQRKSLEMCVIERFYCIKLPVATDWRGSSTAKESPREQGLHIPTAIGDDVNNDLPSDKAIDKPIWLEEDLTKFLVTQPAEFLGQRAARWRSRQAVGNLEDSAKDMLCSPWRIILCYVADNAFQILFGVFGNDYLKCH
jgi:hypothetical protein